MVSPLKLALLADGRPAWRIALEAELSSTALSHLTTGRRPARPEERAALARVLCRPEAELFPAAGAPSQQAA